MKRKSKASRQPAALAALERAAKKAVELGRRTNTPAFVLENGAIVDATKRRRPKKKGAA